MLYPDADVHWLPLDPGQPPRKALDEGLGWPAVAVCVAVACWFVGVFVSEADCRMLSEAVVEGELDETEMVVVATLLTHNISHCSKQQYGCKNESFPT
jgi:hypothetical protein